jgi:hypothetical protein
MAAVTELANDVGTSAACQAYAREETEALVFDVLGVDARVT